MKGSLLPTQDCRLIKTFADVMLQPSLWQKDKWSILLKHQHKLITENPSLIPRCSHPYTVQFYIAFSFAYWNDQKQTVGRPGNEAKRKWITDIMIKSGILHFTFELMHLFMHVRRKISHHSFSAHLICHFTVLLCIGILLTCTFSYTQVVSSFCW